MPLIGVYYDDPSLDSSKMSGVALKSCRPNSMISSLLPLDAPTQRRKYAGPPATSSKYLSTILAGKRPRGEALEEEKDEPDADEPLAPNTTEREQVEWKRRKNVLAARRSRGRKLEYQRELEESVENLTLEKDVWWTRALTLRQILQSHGIPFIEFQD